MNYKSLNQVKDLYERMCDFFDSAETIIKNPFDLSFKEIFELEVGQFILFISASDGKITESEALVFNFITGNNFTPDNLVRVIKTSGSLDNFDNKVPASFNILTKLEEIYNSNAELSKKDHDFTEILYTFYRLLGSLVAGADDDVDSTELINYFSFMKTQKAYLKEHGININD